jgi:hypothetical protein
MKIDHLTVIALLLSSPAFAQSEPRYFGGASPGGSLYSVTTSDASGAPVRLMHNANECPPDRAQPVWGTGSVLLGYSCVTPKR